MDFIYPFFHYLLQAPCVFQFWSWGIKFLEIEHFQFLQSVLVFMFPLNLECKTVVALTSSTIETACVEAALVVVSLVIVSVVEVSSVEVVAVAVVEAVGVPIVVAAASTVVVVSTKEDPAKKRWEQRG